MDTAVISREAYYSKEICGDITIGNDKSMKATKVGCISVKSIILMVMVWISLFMKSSLASGLNAVERSFYLTSNQSR
jgi:hypothetical protein